MDQVVEAEDLYRFYRSGDEEVRALRGVSLSVAAGETVAVVGASGAGKSTLISCIAGLDEPSGGTVRIGGERMTGRSETDRTRLRAHRIGMVMQSGNLFGHLTVAQNVRFAARFGDRSRARGAFALDAVGLAHRSRALPAELSGGEAVRAAVAVALAARPSLLIADEPTGELDGAAEADVLALLADVAARGAALLLVTHSARVTEQADVIVRLRDGRVEGS